MNVYTYAYTLYICIYMHCYSQTCTYMKVQTYTCTFPFNTQFVTVIACYCVLHIFYIVINFNAFFIYMQLFAVYKKKKKSKILLNIYITVELQNFLFVFKL